MGIVTYEKVNVLFKTLCFFFSICIVVSWIQRYSLHKLASATDLKDYFDTKMALQPVFSICVTDPQLNEKVKQMTPGYNKSTYIRFLQGDVYYEELKKLDFEHIRFNWSQYFYETPIAYIVSKNGTYSGKVPMSPKYGKYYTSFVGLMHNRQYLTNCLAIEPFTNEVNRIRIVLNRSILEEKKRSNYKFRVFFHYPHQIFRSYSNSKYLWEDWNSTKDYKMTFYVDDVEVLQRHKNRNNKCITDWNNYDEVVLEKHLEKIGCRSPYQVYDGSPRNVCSTMNEMKKSQLPLNNMMLKSLHVGLW